MDRDCSKIFLMIKFAMDAKADEMETILTSMLGNIKGLLGEVAPDMADLIDSIKVECRSDGNTVYIVVEMTDPFFDEMSSFLKEMTSILNPDAQIMFQILI